VQVFRREDILANVRHRGAQMGERLHASRHQPIVRDVRGIGLMWGVVLADPQDGRPAGALARRVQAAALHRGLILECGGQDDCVVRMLPSLNVTAEIIDMACSILAAALEEATLVH
jgi:diaminobutyrate-2-oxoglutarate transaminase